VAGSNFSPHHVTSPAYQPRSISQRESASRLHTHTRGRQARDSCLSIARAKPALIQMEEPPIDALNCLAPPSNQPRMLRESPTVTYSQPSVCTPSLVLLTTSRREAFAGRQTHLANEGVRISQLFMGKKCLGSEQYRQRQSRNEHQPMPYARVEQEHDPAVATNDVMIETPSKHRSYRFSCS